MIKTLVVKTAGVFCIEILFESTDIGRGSNVTSENPVGNPI